ncbi:RNA polymerase sigma factor [Ferroacidibacillus organovorans]|uniref:RNA polymerase subunit sigma-24 n=1 Tax=Ferroacidibacillus organovorans TaxID=1765683 RepID=A0A853KDN1_9BACL|nr:sigma-70 family RNA polymerase sigma factor [Ferroacidibacillus organovorans]KYP81365.1 hypothetical protein AYJ22_00955 [Ferroacidibacillus organovorans]OAG95152.1 hypothetical protein AYW79_01555 [Ferroacidibacillus organovorans]
MSELQSDEFLLEGIARREQAALETFYDRHERMVFSFALRCVADRSLAEEVVQDVFTRLWRSAERYDGQKAKVSTWLLTITRRIAIDHHRKSMRNVPVQSDVDDRLQQLEESDPGPPEQVEANEMKDLVRSALNRLPNDQREAIERMYYQGQTQKEIAEAIRVPLGTVKGRIRLGLARLREQIDVHGWGDTT